MLFFTFIIVKTDVVNKNESLLKLFEIYLSGTGNLLKAKNMKIGFCYFNNYCS